MDLWIRDMDKREDAAREPEVGKLTPGSPE
jgi:hypothetical protein